MIRRDYILRMIEGFMQALSRIGSLQTVPACFTRR